MRTWYSGYMFVTSTRTSTLNLRAMTTDEQQHEYLIISHNDNDDPAARCLGQAKVILNGNKDLGAITEKRIVPLAGSVRGANGSDFHTSLTISFAALRSGRIVFRPTGTVASDSDPFLRYAFGDNDEPGPSEFYWDDVVAAMGASGTGSLEIIPDPVGDETALHVPNVSARVYNVAQNGTFGSDAEAVRPAEWFLNPVTQHSGAGIFVPAAHGNVRRNIGFRTLTEVSYEITLFAPGGKARHFSGSAPANFTYFSSLDAFVGQPVAANEQVHVSFSNGYAIGFYTVTDNVTNDPAMIVQSPAALEDSVSWGYR
ncbi:MAG TPA: hypothetical protein VJZ00_17615 [Thermoanaerobaculia bacterium]|nr:hypothetical protein [Thermoanaerobaculia bacterium]